MSADEVADVCLLLEGSYPYVAGGVSSWVNDLLHAQSDLRFRIVALVPDPSWNRPRYELPGNVIAMDHVYLQEVPRGARSVRRQRQLLDQLKPHLLRLQSVSGGLDDLAAVLELLSSRGRGKLGRDVLLNSDEAWQLLTAMYDETMPETSFLDYFWTWRSLMGGLFATVLGPLPPARTYHAVSTGYAGLLLARAHLETGRPALLTEHGIYTNERRIEIAMADWLYEGTRGSLGIEKPRRDLKDLWIDTFVSYSRACYAASERIITLYGGNQELQRRDGADPARLEVIPNGIDYERFAALPRQDDDRPPTIALIGRGVHNKDVKTYIRAAVVLRERVPDVQALVLGPTEEDEGYYEECRNMVAHLGAEETVRFLGRVRLDDYLGRLDAIALTSISEAQPLVILEAGAAGVPTVATDVGACREMLMGMPDEDPPLGPGGAVTPLANPAATASALGDLLVNREWREACSRAIRERVRRYYNKVDLDRTYNRIYRECGAKPDAPPAARRVA